MAARKASRAAMEAAMQTFDREYRDDSKWSNWENHKSHRFAIREDHRLYPVKMIVSLALGESRKNFSGGDDSGDANAIARKAGCEVIALRPDWVRDELILTLDLYLRVRNTTYRQDSAEISQLSRFLKDCSSLLHDVPSTNRFRNVNGVYMKLMNFRHFDKTTGEAKGLSNGGQLDEEVWREFGNDPLRCKAAADTIRTALLDLTEHPEWNDPNGDEEEAEEGRATTRVHRGRERNRKIVRKKKDVVLRTFGRLSCEVCAFEFGAFYGQRGAGFIECHHDKPLHTMKPGEKTKLSDLRLVCANCHRMIHSARPWLTIDKLRKVIGRTSD